MELCRQGLAVAYLPDFIVKLHNQEVVEKFRLQPLPFPKGLRRQRQAVYVIQRKSDVEGDVIKKIAKALRIISSKLAT